MSVTASMLWHKCESSWLLQYKHAGPHAGRLRERLILRAAETHWGCQLKHRKEPREQNTEQRNEKSCETKVSLQSIDHEESGFWPNRARSRRPACVSAGWANQMVRFSKETQAVLHTAKKSSRFVDLINVWCRSFLWETTRRVSLTVVPPAENTDCNTCRHNFTPSSCVWCKETEISMQNNINLRVFWSPQSQTSWLESFGVLPVAALTLVTEQTNSRFSVVKKCTSLKLWCFLLHTVILMHCSKTKGTRFCQQMEEHVRAPVWKLMMETLQAIRGRILWLLYYSFSKTGALHSELLAAHLLTSSC